MDYCNNHALCEATELKALKYSILATSQNVLVTEIFFFFFQRNNTWLLFAQLLQKKVKKIK